MTDTNSDTNLSDPNDAPLPPAQDAGQMPVNPDLQTGPPTVALPLTGSTGQGFNTPDALAGTMPTADLNAPAQTAPTNATPSDAPLPAVGSIDRDALDGERAPAGSQANAEAIASTGPV